MANNVKIWWNSLQVTIIISYTGNLKRVDNEIEHLKFWRKFRTLGWRWNVFCGPMHRLAVTFRIMWWRRYKIGSDNKIVKQCIKCYKQPSIHGDVITWKHSRYCWSLTDSYCKGAVIRSLMFPVSMMTSWIGNLFRVTGSLCGELTGDRWIPCTKASDAELWCFLWSAPEYTVE